MKIGILQTGHVANEIHDKHGDYARMFAKLLQGHGFDFRTWNVVDSEFPEDPGDADGWLVTGSRHGAYEAHPWIPRLEGFLRDRYGQDPIVGVCFGHQILAQALGGKVEKFPGGWCVGRTQYTMRDSSEPVTLNAWHQDQVTGLPEEASVLASSDFCENAILSYGPHAYSIQPHPEFGHSLVEALIELRGVGIVPEERLEGAKLGLGKHLDNGAYAASIAGFFKSHARGASSGRGG